MLIHACAISLHDQGVLIMGESGSGKSTLCLELIDRGAALVADDQVLLHVKHNRLHATAPDILAGIIELRGFSPMRLQPDQWLSNTMIDAVVRLTNDKVERVLDPLLTESLLGIELPVIPVNPLDGSLALKLNHYFQAKSDGRLVEGLAVASSANCA